MKTTSGNQWRRNSRRSSRAAIARDKLLRFRRVDLGWELLEPRWAPAGLAHSLALDNNTEYLRVNHDGELDLNDTGEFTVEAWVRRDETNIQQFETIVSNGIPDSYWVGIWDGQVQLMINADISQRGNAVIPRGVWTHVAVTWREGGVQQYYINGNLDYSGPANAAPGEDDGSMTIGNDLTGIIPMPLGGTLSDLRIWNRVRTPDEIRHSMHVVIEEPLPGLVANWQLSESFADSVGWLDATAVGTPQLTGPPGPAQYARAAVDEHFHQLAEPRSGAAVVPTGTPGRALMIGVRRGTTVTTRIEAVDTATGEVSLLGFLPRAVQHASAAYAPNQDAVFVFGGTNLAGDDIFGSIFEVAATTGTVRTLATALPDAGRSTAAVYHPGVDKIYVLGGAAGSSIRNTIQVFDPQTRTVTVAPIRLPGRLADMAAIYSPETGDIYLFGGVGEFFPSDRIYRLSVDPTDPTGHSFSIATLRYLPAAAAGLTVTQDPVSKLIYVVGGYSPYSQTEFDHLIAFDPLTHNVWRTQLPVQRADAGLVYDARNRHALVIGGSVEVAGVGLTPQADILRIPLGDGPAVPLGRWDFPAPIPGGAGVSPITDVHGDENRVIVGTNGDGAWRYDSGGNRYHYDRNLLGSSSGVVNAVLYNAARNTVLIGTDDNGVYEDNGSEQVTLFEGTRVLSLGVVPEGHPLAGAPFIGTDEGLYHIDLSGPIVWSQALPGEPIRAMAQRAAGDLWVIASNHLKNVRYDGRGHVSITNFGARFLGAVPDELVIAPNGEFWATVAAAEFGAGIYRLLVDAHGMPVGDAQRIEPDAEVMGNLASGVTVDAEGRIWVSVEASETSSGGLVAFEVDEELRGNDPVNWLNGPLGEARAGSTVFNTGSFWSSNLQDVAGVDERIWTGRQDGTLITYAQRWSQIDQSNGLDDKVVREVWTARGRLFAATDTELLVLQPDGRTWDNRELRVQDVLADSQGNLWIGTEDGPRWYLRDGWDQLTNRLGQRPANRVSAIAEDLDGRIWLGGSDGLTLFDRDRFVTTFTSDNSPLPQTAVRALAVDRDNRLWIGTNQGLAVFQNDVEWTVLMVDDGLPSNVIRDLELLADGRMAASTNGGLVYVGRDFSVTVDASVPLDTSFWRLATDDVGRLWVDNAVRTADGWQVFHDTNSGLRSTDISGVAADRADRIWFGHAPDAGLSVRGSYLPPLGNVYPSFDPANAISPTQGRNGTVVEIRGTGFGDNAQELGVTVGGADAEVIEVSNQRIRVRIGPHTISGDVSVTRAGRRVTLENAFRAVPVITSFTPTGGNAGVRVTITGSNFDRTAQVRLGGGAFRPAFWVSPTELETTIQPTDGVGRVEVQNFAPWNSSLPPLTATPLGEFRRIDLDLQEVVFNQGIGSTGLVAHRETFVQNFLRHSLAPRPEDRLEIDRAEFLFPGTDPIVVDVCPLTIADCNVAFATRSGDVTDADRADIVNSFNVTIVPPGHGAWSGSSDYQVRLWRRGFLVDEGTGSIHVRPNTPLRVLLVPIMRNGSSEVDIARIHEETERGLDELRHRIMPVGDVEFYWSPLTYEVKDVITRINGDARSIALGNILELFDASHELDEARSWWNEHRNPEVLVSFGVVDSRIVESSDGDATGQAFWPDLSEMLNDAGLDVIDTLCDAVDTVVNVLTLGSVGGDGCELDIPLYVGWARHDGNIEVPGQQSDLFGHELGHIMGLVKPWAYNGTHEWPVPFITDNFSHSLTDELLGGACDEGGTEFRRDETLYYQPGVKEPVVNPLSSRQLYRLPGTGENETERGKAIMSYACGGRNYNALFEPVDLIEIYSTFAAASAGSFVHDLTTGLPVGAGGEAEPPGGGASPTSPGALVPASTSGQRLYLSGVVNRVLETGAITRVATRGDASRVSLSVESGYWLVQLDADGHELSRWGVFPQFSTSEVHEGADGFFAATVFRHPEVARIELRHGDTLLDVRQPGSQVPDVSIDTAPLGLVVGPGMLDLSWTASDPDGDSLAVTVLYSPDDGHTWTAIAPPGAAANSLRIPTTALANSGVNEARLQVLVDDGLRRAAAISAPFTLSGLAPTPWIGAPTADTKALEGRPVRLSGAALDSAGPPIGGTQLRWSSDRDGSLGTGEELQVFLSVGRHEITLAATNSQGITSQVTTSIDVQPDYDFDGLSDAEELTLGLNPLHSHELFTDVDGDGVNLYVELLRGTNPAAPDSDGDGRRDGLEIGAGTDPAQADEPAPADRLQVFPSAIELDGDLSRGIPFPQQQVDLITRTVTEWTVRADVPWLAASQARGAAPGGVTILVDAHLLDDGVHEGQLSFTSVELGDIVTVPVTVTISHSAAHFDVNRDGLVNSLDSDEVAAREGLTSSDEGFRYVYDLDRDGDIDRDDLWFSYERTNTAPNVSVNFSQIAVNEGAAASNHGEFSDIDPMDSVSITSSVGSISQDPGNRGVWSWSFATTDGPRQSQTVTITADDHKRGTAYRTFELVVDNVPPTGVLTAPSEVDEGSLLIVELGSGDDPSADDIAAGFEYAFDLGSGFGDYSPITVATISPPDDQMLIVRGRIRDKDGGITEYDQSVIVRNVAPQITLDPIDSTVEDGIATLTGTISDPGTPDSFTVRVNWGDPDSPVWESLDLPPAPTGTQAFTLTHRYADDQPSSTPSDQYSVTVRVTDDDLGEVEDFAPVVVENIPPRIEHVAVSESVIREGDGLEVQGTFSDPGTHDQHDVLIDWGDGSPPSLLQFAGAERAFSATHRYLDDDPTTTPRDQYSITVRVTDDDTGTDSTALSVFVENVDPVFASFRTTGTEVGDTAAGDPLGIFPVFSDAGILDTHEATIDWGDGLSTAGIVCEVNGSGHVSGSHVFTRGGVYTIAVALNDDDGGSATASAAAFVTGVGVHHGVLQVVGGSGHDNVQVLTVGDSIQVVASFLTGGPLRFPAGTVSRVEVYVGAGDDQVQIHPSITKLAYVSGGPGKDHLRSGSGDTHLDGGDGDDDLQGGAGNDVLVGGLGDDSLDGGRGQNLLIGGSGTDVLKLGNENPGVIGSILIGGRTSWDDDRAVLRILLDDAWVAPLRQGTSYESAVGLLLAARLVPGSSVFDDQSVDKLAGSRARDLFFADIDRRHEDDDQLTGISSDELVIDLAELLSS